MICGPTVYRRDTHIEGVGRRRDFEWTLDVRALSGHIVDIRVKVLVVHKMLELFAVLTHVSNGLLAHATMFLFVRIHLLRKRTEEAVAVTDHVHLPPTVGLESSEATTQLGIFIFRPHCTPFRRWRPLGLGPFARHCRHRSGSHIKSVAIRITSRPRQLAQRKTVLFIPRHDAVIPVGHASLVAIT
jgi:hypothetical protein